jgi:hypothetical protein
VNDTSLNPKDAVAIVLGRKPVLPTETENTLFSYCTDMNAIYFGLFAVCTFGLSVSHKAWLATTIFKGRSCSRETNY